MDEMWSVWWGKRRSKFNKTRIYDKCKQHVIASSAYHQTKSTSSLSQKAANEWNQIKTNDNMAKWKRTKREKKCIEK